MEEVKQGDSAPKSEAPKEAPTPPSDAKETVKKPRPRPLAERTREDIYDRYDAKFEAPKDSSVPSPVKEESKPAQDLKQDAESGQHPVEDVDDSEKPTSVKKGKEDASVVADQKTVPLQALHEARDRFKKLNLEYREYKNSQAKEIDELKVQLSQLQSKLSEPSTTATESDLSDDHEVIKRLQREITELKTVSKQTVSNQAKESAQQAQQEQQKKITSVTKELTKEGYPGFDKAILQTGTILNELVTSGEITESESFEPSMWKQVYKDRVYNDFKAVFVEKAKDEVMESKVAKKKKAALVSDPGKAPEKPEEEDKKPMTLDEFNRQAMVERQELHKKKFYKRHV
jgi:hypothetical protein